MLNEKQQQVIDYNNSLVNIAGPGSGKTHTLISKISKIVLEEKDILDKLLVLTFTNSAALEIKERALQKLSTRINTTGLYFGTFHSLFKKLLTETEEFLSIGFESIPNITTPNEINRYITDLIQHDFIHKYSDLSDIAMCHFNNSESNLVENYQSKPITKTVLKSNLIDGISLIKIFEDCINYTSSSMIGKHSLLEVFLLIKEQTINRLKNEIKDTLIKINKYISEHTIQVFTENMFELKFSSDTFGVSLYYLLINKKISIGFVLKNIDKYLTLFIKNKFNQSIISFGDILLITLYSLKTNHSFLFNIQNKFKYIFVDEYQDTNIIESEILQLIYNNTLNKICVIGDPYQSIYGFLGAKIENILSAEKYFKAYKIQLLYNYRSNKNIVELTNYLGNNMIEKIDKWEPCISANKSAENYKITFKNYLSKEEQADYIIQKINDIPIRKTVGIISRIGTVYEMENYLNKNGILYDKLGGKSLSESIEIKSIIHLFFLINSTEFYKKIDSICFILENIQGIGKISISKYKNYLVELSKNIPIDKFSIPKKISEILSILIGIKNINDFQLQKKLLHKFYYDNLFNTLSRTWKESRLLEAKEKTKILFNEIDELEDLYSVVSLLDEYISNTNNSKTDTKKRITLSTIHSAKGLEWDVVFLINWSNKYFIRDELSEAKRLNYVSVSRAKEQLYLLSEENNFFDIPIEYILSNPDMYIIDNTPTPEEKLIIKFGKYKGQLVDDLPFSYIRWILDNKEDLLLKRLINNKIVVKIEELIS